jgi:hypothetical protein
VRLKPDQFKQELMNFGYTIVPPEAACPNQLHLRLLETVQRLADAEPADRRINNATAGRQLYYLLAADPLFTEAVMNPMLLELARFLIREPIISGVSANLKPRNSRDLPLHIDQPLHPYPESSMFTAVYYLTPVSAELGGTCFVPYSHNWLRPPVGRETELDNAAALVSISAPAGSLAIWHGNTWHGAHHRSVDGTRVQLMVQWCNKWMRPQEAYREHLSDAIVTAGGAEFAELLGASVYFGWTESGPDRTPGAAFKAARQRTE